MALRFRQRILSCCNAMAVDDHAIIAAQQRRDDLLRP
jgi:hypothetical protein